MNSIIELENEIEIKECPYCKKVIILLNMASLMVFKDINVKIIIV